MCMAQVWTQNPLSHFFSFFVAIGLVLSSCRSKISAECSEVLQAEIVPDVFRVTTSVSIELELQDTSRRLQILWYATFIICDCHIGQVVIWLSCTLWQWLLSVCMNSATLYIILGSTQSTQYWQLNMAQVSVPSRLLSIKSFRFQTHFVVMLYVGKGLRTCATCPPQNSVQHLNWWWWCRCSFAGIFQRQEISKEYAQDLD